MLARRHLSRDHVLLILCTCIISKNYKYVYKSNWLLARESLQSIMTIILHDRSTQWKSLVSLEKYITSLSYNVSHS